MTDQPLRVLGGRPDGENWIEVREHLIHVTKKDKLDLVVSVALGTRLLAHKYSQIPKQYFQKNPKVRSLATIRLTNQGKTMQRRFYLDMKLLKIKGSLWVVLCLFVFSYHSVAFSGDVPVDRDFMRLPDHRWIWLEKT